MVNLTLPTLRVLGSFLADPQAERYGLELAAELDLRSGTLYPILGRLERVGWLQSRREEIDPRAAGRPRRRLYRLTGAGEFAARDAIDEHLKRASALERASRARQPRLGLGGI